jgi:hypothetical protein
MHIGVGQTSKTSRTCVLILSEFQRRKEHCNGGSTAAECTLIISTALPHFREAPSLPPERSALSGPALRQPSCTGGREGRLLIIFIYLFLMNQGTARDLFSGELEHVIEKEKGD